MFLISPPIDPLKRGDENTVPQFLKAGELGTSEWLDFEIWESQAIFDKTFCLFQVPTPTPKRKKKKKKKSEHRKQSFTWVKKKKNSQNVTPSFPVFYLHLGVTFLGGRRDNFKQKIVRIVRRIPRYSLSRLTNYLHFYPF